MRRPFTTRRWFRVGLVIVVLIGGYMAAYLTLRTWDASGVIGVSVNYPHSNRYYATSEAGKLLAGLYAGAHSETGLISSYVEGPSSSQVSSDEIGISDRIAEVYLPAADNWQSTACRVFYLAERIELWVRGFKVEPGESVVVDG